MRGAALLAAFVKRSKLSQAEFARLHGFSAPLLNMWLSGQRLPGRVNSQRIAVATAGGVPVGSWDVPSRRRAATG